jgi:hypothetical protein
MAVCKWKATENFNNFIRVLKRENVFYKNLVKQENIYLAVTPKTKLLNFVWLDDIKLENISKEQKEYMTLIETSEGNYQAWIQLNKVYSAREVQEIKKYLVEQLGADKAATAKIQPMRLPGFYSYKHQFPHYVKVVNTATKKLNASNILKKINNNISNKPQQKPQPNSKKNKSTNWKRYSYYKTKLFYSNKKFNPLDERDAIIKFVKQDNEDIEVDENIIDIHYIYQLVIRGYGKEKIYFYLEKSRPDLTIKHKSTIDYFMRTYLKALLFYKKFYPELKLYENNKINEILENKPASQNMIEFLEQEIEKLE